MIIIGITGSIGMGKTTVSAMLKILKIPVFDSDKEVKNILEKNNEVLEKISKIWPETVTSAQNMKIINKALLGNKIFNNIKDKRTLERIIHPLIKDKRLNFIKVNQNSSIIGLDVPLLYETGTDKICDYVFLVNTSRRKQKQRVLSRKDMTEKKFNQINKMQWSFDRKKKKKPLLISTSYGKIFSFFIILVYLLGIFINYKVRNDKRTSTGH